MWRSIVVCHIPRYYRIPSAISFSPIVSALFFVVVLVAAFLGIICLLGHCRCLLVLAKWPGQLRSKRAIAAQLFHFLFCKAIFVCCFVLSCRTGGVESLSVHVSCALGYNIPGHPRNYTPAYQLTKTSRTRKTKKLKKKTIPKTLTNKKSQETHDILKYIVIIVIISIFNCFTLSFWLRKTSEEEREKEKDREGERYHQTVEALRTRACEYEMRWPVLQRP